MTISITFNDGSGSQTITPSNAITRFNDWIPAPSYFGEIRHALGDNRRYQYAHRVDHRAGFVMPNLGRSEEAKLQKFILHANSGGLFDLDTDDSESNTYSNLQVDEGGEVTMQWDGEMLEFTLVFPAVVNLDVTPVPLRQILA